MNKYIHIGYPKTLTTTLQRCFFDKHPELYHLGIGCGSNIAYRTHDLHRMVEPYLVYCRDMKFAEKEEYFHKMLKKNFNEARLSNFKASGISCELLSLSLPDHCDTTAKAARLHRLFGSGTKIIILIREQFALIQSMYIELVRQGYMYSFPEFADYLYTFQDRSFFYDLLFDKTYSLYAGYFGKENVLIQPIEGFLTENKELKISDSKISLIEELGSFLEIGYVPLEIERHNPSMVMNAVANKLELNSLNVHDYGNCMFRPAFTHRMLPYFEDDVQVELPCYAIEDVKTKRETIRKAENMPAGKVLDFSVPEKLRSRLENMFRTSNNRLRQITSLDLAGYLQ